MKIATWNVERLRHKSKLSEIVNVCNSIQADILILTETDERIRPNFKYCFKTPALSELHSDMYLPTENRVSIYTNYEGLLQYDTYDKYTSVCVMLDTQHGKLLVYGTIIGVYGNRDSTFMPELQQQMNDVARLSKLGDGLCFCGDFNCSFVDNYYFTKDGRNSMLGAFRQNDITILTQAKKECVDHIALSNRFLSDRAVQIEEWNFDKSLSDHKGIAVTF